MKFEFMPRYTKYLCWYKTEIDKERSCGFIGLFTFICLLVITLIVFGLKGCNKDSKIHYASHFSKQEVDFIIEFAKRGSPNPIEMGIAVCKTKRPRLMTALALKESGGDPKAIGDSGESKGAFQVQEKHWSAVPTTATEQALQAEKILEELVASSRGRLLYALSRYNSGKPNSRIGKRYAKNVMAIQKNIKVI